jgi:tetratricopeptide (TPR) repeat protein
MSEQNLDQATETQAAPSATPNDEAQLVQMVEMFEVIAESQPQDYQSLEILKEAYIKLGREEGTINTSKRIAKAYVLMGQYSSAILEYESVLQLRPDDAEALAALGEIENRAGGLNTAPAAEPAEAPRAPARSGKGQKGDAAATAVRLDDGRQSMMKVFVEAKHVTQADFDQCWEKANPSASTGAVVEPFIQCLADKGILPLEKSLKILSDKQKMGYLPLDKYDIDIELARSFPAVTCQRWCVLPFDRMGKAVLVATANPFNKQAAHELELATKQRLLWYLASPPEIVKAIRKACR